MATTDEERPAKVSRRTKRSAEPLVVALSDARRPVEDQLREDMEALNYDLRYELLQLTARVQVLEEQYARAIAPPVAPVPWYRRLIRR